MDFYNDSDAALALARQIKVSAKDRRYAAMRIVHAYADAVWTEPGTCGIYVNTPESRAKIAAFIRTLAPMGRTEIWQNNVEAWAQVVEDEKDFQWGFIQYSIYTGHANS
jgi:hypothetical protein